MSMFDIIINLIETALMVIFCYSLCEHQCRRNRIISVIFIIADTLWITYINTQYVYEQFLFLIDILFFFIYLSFVTDFSISKKLVIAFFVNSVINIINTSIVIILSVVFYHGINFTALTQEHHILLLILTKIILAIALYFTSEQIRSNSFSLDSKEYWYILVLLILCNIMFISMGNLIFLDEVNKVYLLLALISIIIFTVLLLRLAYQWNIKDREVLHSQYEINLLNARLADSKNLLDSQEQLHQMRHDLKHLLTLCSSSDSPDRDQELQHLADIYKDKIDHVVLPIQTCDTVIDHVLNIKRKEASIRDIDFVCRLNYTHPAAIEKTDLELILCNLIDNAMDHIGMERHIDVAISISRSNFQFHIINSIDHSVLDSNHNFLSLHRNAEHGYGVDTVRRIAEKYHGNLFYVEDGRNLTAQVLLPDCEDLMSEAGKAVRKERLYSKK